MMLSPASQRLLAQWPVTPGQVWQCGSHRVMCGDATDLHHVVQLMDGQPWRCLCTSPPYLSRRHYQQRITDWQALALGFMEAAMLWAAPDSDALVNLGLIYEHRRVVRYWEPWLDACEARGWPLFGWYVWDKLSGFPGNHYGRLAPTHEWLFHFQQGSTQAQAWIATKTPGARRSMTSSVRDPNGQMRHFTSSQPVGQYKVPDSVLRIPRYSVLRIPRYMRRRSGGDFHPAMQAQEFQAAILYTWSQPDDVVYDPFGGSGQTLLTAHALGRRCVIMDIAPVYVALMLQRWLDVTGELPRRLQ